MIKMYWITRERKTVDFDKALIFLTHVSEQRQHWHQGAMHGNHMLWCQPKENSHNLPMFKWAFYNGNNSKNEIVSTFLPPCWYPTWVVQGLDSPSHLGLILSHQIFFGQCFSFVGYTSHLQRALWQHTPGIFFELLPLDFHSTLILSS